MKKGLSVLLAALLVLGMGLGVFAANKYVAFDPGRTLLDGYVMKGGDTKGKREVNLGTIYAGNREEREIFLYDNMFTTKAGEASTILDADRRLLSQDDIRGSKIEAKTTVRGGSKVFKDISLDSKNGKIDVKFVTDYNSTDSQDFEVFIFLTIDGKRMDEAGITLYGTFANQTLDAYKEYDYIDISGGFVVDAQENVNNIQLDIGNGVSVYTNLIKGKQYYGDSSINPDSKDEAVMRDHPDIDAVINVRVVGLSGSGTTVRMQDGYGSYYVYDGDLNYLGRGSDTLPYSSKYYLAVQTLNVSDDYEPETEATQATEAETSQQSGQSQETETGTAGNEEPTAGQQDDASRDDGYSDNVWEGDRDEMAQGGGGYTGGSPDTGDRNLIPMAALAAVLSLAAGAVVSKKK